MSWFTNLFINEAKVALDRFGSSGGSGSSGGVVCASKKEVNFFDYDGTVLYSYTVDEAKSLTKLPDLPRRDGLICQGWNYDLETIKAYDRPVDVGAIYITDDGTTRLYISLEEGRTAPKLSILLNGTCTVDWGDGTTPDILIGTSMNTSYQTPIHEYSKPGDYVVRLTIDGEAGFSQKFFCLSSSSSDKRSYVYCNAIRKVEFGNGFNSIRYYSFDGCTGLKSITIHKGLTTIEYSIFYNCYSLEFVVFPNLVTSIEQTMFSNCYALKGVSLPNTITPIKPNAFNNCYTLPSIVIPDSCQLINGRAFTYCRSLSSLVIPKNLTSIEDYVFGYCYGVRYYDFTKHVAVPSIGGTNVFVDKASDFEIRVPAALVDEWKADDKWSKWADNIVGV